MTRPTLTYCFTIQATIGDAYTNAPYILFTLLTLLTLLTLQNHDPSEPGHNKKGRQPFQVAAGLVSPALASNLSAMVLT
jgi:hypothetical protein